VAGLNEPQPGPDGVAVQVHVTPPFALSLSTEATTAVWLLEARDEGTVFRVTVIGALEPLLHPASKAIVARAIVERIGFRNVIEHLRFVQAGMSSWLWRARSEETAFAQEILEGRAR